MSIFFQTQRRGDAEEKQSGSVPESSLRLCASAFHASSENAPAPRQRAGTLPPHAQPRTPGHPALNGPFTRVYGPVPALRPDPATPFFP